VRCELVTRLKQTSSFVQNRATVTQQHT
jgi:hypothetical protein